MYLFSRSSVLKTIERVTLKNLCLIVPLILKLVEGDNKSKNWWRKNGQQESLMCHQCRSNICKNVVVCSNCKRKRYCYGCIKSWYPKRTIKEFKVACPYCRGNCNCRNCLHANVVVKAIHKESNDDLRLQRSLYLLKKRCLF